MSAARTLALEPFIDQCRGWKPGLRPDAGARLAGVVGWIRQAWCGLGGHAMLLRFEPERLSLQCMNCGHASPGWDVRHGSCGTFTDTSIG